MKRKKSFKWKGLLFACMWVVSIGLFAQNITVSGTITDADNEPVIGATVVVQGEASHGTVTDIDGNYTLTNVPPNATLQFSYVGMATQVVPVNGKTTINIVLAADTEMLEEVVVTALGMKRSQKALGYAVKELKGEELVTNIINPVNALQGKVAGVEIAQSDGGMFGSTKILIRGASTLGKNNQPIYVVDGVILDNAISKSGDADWDQAANDYGNELKNLNPQDFATVSVLKGAAATALYGSRGLNGAVVITTKSGQSRQGIGIQVSQTLGADYVYKQPDMQNIWGEGAMAGYVDYGTTKPDGSYYAFDNQRQFMLNSENKHTLMGDWSGLSFGPRFDGSDIEYYDKSYKAYRPVKNNFKDTYDLGFNTNTNVAISGGNEKTTFYTSLGYLYNHGTLPNNDFKRLSLLTKASHNITDRVNVEASLSFANSNPRNAQPNIGEFFTDGTWSRSYDSKLLKKKYKGEHGGLASTSYGDMYGSVPGRDKWWTIYENDYRRKETSVRPGLIVRTRLTDWLDFTAEGNYNYYYTRDENKQLGSGYANEGGYYAMSQYTKEQTNLNASFNALYSLSDWTFSGFVRGEYFNTVEQYSKLNTNGGLIVPGQYFVGNSKENVGYDGYISGQKRMYSIAAQFSASWADQVFMDVTGRNDWSSALVYSDGHGTFSYFYPSVSGSWLLHNTFDLPSWISFMKVRGSWAQVGNDTSPYIINTAYSIITSSTSNGKTYSLELPSTVYDTHLKPERKNAWEVGLDWRFLNNRINLDVAYYKENTRDQIMQIAVPYVSGISNQYINAGNIQNKGVEIALNTVPYTSRDFEWTLDFTYTKNDNKIISLHENVADYINLDGSADYGNYRISSVAKVGESYGILMSDSKKAIDENTGLPLLGWSDSRRFSYYRRSGKMEKVGSMIPDFLGSVGTGLRYKNWNLRALMDMRFGGLVASYGSRYGTAYGYTQSSLKYSAPEYGGITWTSKYDNITYSDGLIPEGIIPGGTQITQPDNSKYTVAEGGETYQSLYEKGIVEPTHASTWHYFTNSWGNGVVNDNWVSKLNYIALREVTLSYSVPQNIAKRLRATSLNLSLTGRNLGYLLNNMPNGENPESVRGTSASEFRVRTFSPFTASYMFTVNVGF
ncbi:iron complex outermembrane recepter protein [Porphyromonadaceae bacterium NLAE-zl-C104]|nr:iron complex outermembrane recepter protein [Porphyromonadaceae bacterium KH3R12]SFS80630.1 iron complex outermembrane recepter protein [Porphyromonadaceae bacterium NLAE-zl-C104]